MSRKPGFADETARLELLERFNRVPGVALDPVRVNGEPTVDLMLLAEPHARNANRQSCRRFLLVPHAA